MDIKLNDEAAVAVLVICLLVAFALMASCQLARDRADSDVTKARVAAGLCADTWGRWSKCK